MQLEPITIYFEIPAADPMGREHVEGKIRGLEDEVLLHWKIRERTFTKGKHTAHRISLKYHEIEEVEFQGGWMFFRRSRLIFRVCEPARLEGMPGSATGRCVLRVAPKSRQDAGRLAKFLDYKVSEYRLTRSEDRLEELLEEPQAGMIEH